MDFLNKGRLHVVFLSSKKHGTSLFKYCIKIKRQRIRREDWNDYKAPKLSFKAD